MSQESTCVEVSFNKVAGPQNYNFIKMILQHRFFLVNTAKFLRTPCFTEYLWWLLLTIPGFQPVTLLTKRPRQICFSVNFAKFLRTFFDRISPDDCFLCISVNLEKFFRTPFLWSTSGKLPISCTSCRISNTRYSKNLFRCFSSNLYKNEK